MTRVRGVIALLIRSTKWRGRGSGTLKETLLTTMPSRRARWSQAVSIRPIILVGDDHLVAALQVDSQDQGLHPLGGVAGDGEFLGVAAEIASQVAADGLDPRLQHLHMWWAGISLLKRRSRIIWSSTWAGDGLTPPLLKLIERAVDVEGALDLRPVVFVAGQVRLVLAKRVAGACRRHARRRRCGTRPAHSRRREPEESCAVFRHRGALCVVALLRIVMPFGVFNRGCHERQYTSMTFVREWGCAASSRKSRWQYSCLKAIVQAIGDRPVSGAPRSLPNRHASVKRMNSSSRSLPAFSLALLASSCLVAAASSYGEVTTGRHLKRQPGPLRSRKVSRSIGTRSAFRTSTGQPMRRASLDSYMPRPKITSGRSKTVISARWAGRRRFTAKSRWRMIS